MTATLTKSLFGFCASWLLLANSGAAALAQDQAFPPSTITVINPYSAGGPTDVLTRIVANALSEQLNVTVVPINKPGAGSAVGAQFVAHANPDGATLLVSTGATHIITPVLTPNINFDGIRDFTFVAMFARIPNVLVVRSATSVKNVNDLIALAKAKPGELNYGSVGIGSQTHLAMLLFEQLTGTKLNHVPYKGALPAVMDVLSGQIDTGFFNVPGPAPYIASGQLRALAVSSLKRARQLPDVPALDELGFKGFDLVTWYGLTAPAATPRPIVERLASALTTGMSTPSAKAAVENMGADLYLLGPADFSTYVQEDAARLTPLLKSVTIPGANTKGD